MPSRYRSRLRSAVRGGQDAEPASVVETTTVTSAAPAAPEDAAGAQAVAAESDSVAALTQRVRDAQSALQDINARGRALRARLAPLGQQLAALNQASALELQQLPYAEPSAKQAMLINVEEQNRNRDALVAKLNEGAAQLQELRQEALERAAERDRLARELAETQAALQRTTLENIRSATISALQVR